jgi:hypothetical protein
VIAAGPAEPIVPYSTVKQQQREPGKKSRPGGAAESEQLPPACIASYVKRLYKNGYFFSFYT